VTDVVFVLEEPPFAVVPPTLEEPPFAVVPPTLEEPPFAVVPPTLEEPPFAVVPPMLEEPPFAVVPPTLEEPPVPVPLRVAATEAIDGRAVPLAQKPKLVAPRAERVPLKAAGETFNWVPLEVDVALQRLLSVAPLSSTPTAQDVTVVASRLTSVTSAQ
jgi:hypothetical protein